MFTVVPFGPWLAYPEYCLSKRTRVGVSKIGSTDLPPVVRNLVTLCSLLRTTGSLMFFLVRNGWVLIWQWLGTNMARHDELHEDGPSFLMRATRKTP